MSKYFHVKAIQMDADGVEIVRLTGYFTNQTHTMFLPPQEISREDAIKMLESGIILFTRTKTGQRKLLKKVENSGLVFLRFEN